MGDSDPRCESASAASLLSSSPPKRQEESPTQMRARVCAHKLAGRRVERERGWRGGIRTVHPSRGLDIEPTHRFPFAPGLVPCRSLSTLIILEPINHLTSEPLRQQPPPLAESPSYPDPREDSGVHRPGPSFRRYAVKKSPGSRGLITMFRNNVLCATR